MTRRQRDQRLDRLVHRLERAVTVVPEIRQHLAEQRHYARYGHRGDTTGAGRQSGYSDPTVRLAMAVADVDERQGRIDDMIHTLGVAVDLLEHECSKALSYRTPADLVADDDRSVFEQNNEPICHAAGCDQPVSSFLRTDRTLGYRMTGDYGGMCDAHRARARREDVA